MMAKPDALMESIPLPSNFKPVCGSCMLAAEIMTKKLLRKGYRDFKVIEGYITFEGVDWNESHTWIQMKNNKVIDPTKSQWGIEGEITYLRRKRKTYTPHEYLKSCQKYPELNTSKYLGKFKYLGKDLPELKHLVLDSTEFDIDGILPFVDRSFMIEIEMNLEDFQCGINNDTVWIHNKQTDTYYYHKMLSK